MRRTLAERQDTDIVTYDKLTYAGNLDNLAPVADNPRHRFVHGDICDAGAVQAVFAETAPTRSSILRRSLTSTAASCTPARVIETNVRGTATLLDAARRAGVGRFLHVSTDEVYGDIDEPFEADETFPIRPSSPYAASKAGSRPAGALLRPDVRAAGDCHARFEQLRPLSVPGEADPADDRERARGKPAAGLWRRAPGPRLAPCGRPLPGILAVLLRGREGEVYNVAGTRHLPNIEVIRRLLTIVGAPESLITRVADRPGHDRRYALRGDKIARDTGFVPEIDFDLGLERTVQWYRDNAEWISRVRSGEYRDYYNRNYDWRGEPTQAGASASTTDSQR